MKQKDWRVTCDMLIDAQRPILDHKHTVRPSSQSVTNHDANHYAGDPNHRRSALLDHGDKHRVGLVATDNPGGRRGVPALDCMPVANLSKDRRWPVDV